MSTPPPGGWPPPQQPGQPPSQGQPFGQPYDPSGYNPQQPPPPGWQQGAWTPHSAPPPQKGNSLKWLLIGVAVLLVVAISVGATLLFTRDGNGGGGTTPSSSAPSDIASANDTGAVAVITAEPTCDAFNGINNSLADVEKNGWATQRAGLGPSAEWTADQRAQVETVGKAMRNAADEAVRLAKQTPHRVVRELYEQFIANGRAYANQIKSYLPKDDGLADAFVDAGTTLTGICKAIELGSASRSLTLDVASPPTRVVLVGDPADPARFLTETGSICDRWLQRLDLFDTQTKSWQTRDATIPGSQWTPEERSVEETTKPLISSFAADIKGMGRESDNPVFEDFAEMASLYFDAYAAAGANYVVADSWLSYTGVQVANLIAGACKAAVD